jgi:hypothetical protein
MIDLFKTYVLLDIVSNFENDVPKLMIACESKQERNYKT